jgi:hypothetical protein
VRSRAELAALALCLWLGAATAAAAVAPAPPAAPAVQTTANLPTQAQIERAAAAVKADPHFATEKTVRRLTWNGARERPRRTTTEMPGWLSWLGDLFGWLGEISQMLMWLVIAVLVAGLALLLVRVFQSGRRPHLPKSFVAPTHVRDLDIRPESLPDDIGAAARALWDGGEQRAALALLYRGLLSRLAHVYQVPIRDSSTEGDCLQIAAQRLQAPRLEFATRLVRTWQRAIYGGLSVDTAVAHELCANFDTWLERPLKPQGAGRPLFAAGATA